MQSRTTRPPIRSCAKLSTSLSTSLMSATQTSNWLTSSSMRSTLKFLVLSDSCTPHPWRRAAWRSRKRDSKASRERRRTPLNVAVGLPHRDGEEEGWLMAHVPGLSSSIHSMIVQAKCRHQLRLLSASSTWRSTWRRRRLHSVLFSQPRNGVSSGSSRTLRCRKNGVYYTRRLFRDDKDVVWPV